MNKNKSSNKKILVAGWFSFLNRQATFGDFQAMEVVSNWLKIAELKHDIAIESLQHPSGIPTSKIVPTDYDVLIFICGPWFGSSFSMFGNQYKEHFKSILKIGVDLSVTNKNHGFDLLLPRDFFEIKNPDLVYAAKSNKVLVAGLLMVHPQPMYKNKQRHSHVIKIIREYLELKGHAVLELDTLTQSNPCGIKNASQLESLISKCDFIISSRLHGMVYSLKNNIPVLAIDCVAGGAKVTAQAEAVGWPAILNGDGITVEDIETGVKTAIDNKDKIKQLNIDAVKKISEIEKRLINHLNENK
jgi:hypothetical protein